MKKFLSSLIILVCLSANAQIEKKQEYKQYLKNQMVKDMQNSFSYKSYSKKLLNSFADSIITNNPLPCRIEGFTDIDNEKTFKNLDQLIRTGSSKNKEAISDNLCGIFGKLPKIVEFGSSEGFSEHAFGEIFPNDILLVNLYGGGNFSDSRYYQIKNDNLVSITIDPDDEFYNILNEKISSRAIFNSVRTTNFNLNATLIRKIDNDYYLINSFVRNDENTDSAEVEYKTKDFVKFYPVRYRLDEKNKWKNIK